MNCVLLVTVVAMVASTCGEVEGFYYSRGLGEEVEDGGGEGCGDGMTMVGQFFNCTKPLMEPYRTDSNWLRPGYSLNSAILSYLQTYCSMILPRGVRCFESKLSACDVKTRDFVINDARGAGGFCDGNRVSADVANLFLSLPSASPRSVENCPAVDSASCYSVISRQLYTKDVFYLPASELAPHIQRAFESVFLCLVEKYRSHRADCPDWQLQLLWMHARTFVPNPLGFSLRPALLQTLTP